MLILLSGLGTAAAAATGLGSNVPGTRMEIRWPQFVAAGDIRLTQPPADSYQGLLLGNGDIGVSVFGGPELLTLQVGKNDIWDYRCPMDGKRPVKHSQFIAKYADPAKPPVSNYIWDPGADAWNTDIRETSTRPMPTIKPAGRIRFRNEQAVGARYVGRVGMWNAEARVDTGNGQPALRTFVSYPRNLIVALFDPGESGRFDIELARHKDATGTIPNGPEFGAKGRDLWLRYVFPGDPANYPNGFEYVMYGRVIGGESVTTETRADLARITQAKWRVGQVATDPVETVEGVSVAHVRSSRPVALLVAVVTTRDDARPLARARADVTSAERATLDALEKEHRSWWHNFWQRSLVQIPERPFLAENWVLSQYMLACSWRPGRIAPGLFGAWTWEDHPLFGNDYHWDYNMQQAVWGAYSSNHLEQAVAYNETALNLLPTAITDAKETYGIDGAKFFLTSYPRKYAHNPFPLLHYDKMMSLNGWVAHPVWWYYLYSQDKGFLREQAYPLMRACAAFYEGYLTHADDGRYDIWPTAAWDVDFTPHLVQNRNFPMDLSFIRYLMNACVSASEVLAVDEDKRPRWREIARDLRDYPTADTPDGAVFTAYPGSNSSYHFPLPAMMVFPGDDIGLGSPREKQDIARRTLAPMTYSGDEQLMKAVMRARLGIDDLDTFEKQLRATTRPNGTMSYGDQWFFWVHSAGNSIWLNENLLQSYDGLIRVAPVKLKTAARFAQLRAVGAFLVSGEIMPGGEVAYLAITSEAGKPCSLVAPWNEVRVRRWPEMRSVIARAEEGIVRFDTARGATYVVDTPSQPWEARPAVQVPGNGIDMTDLRTLKP